MSRKSSKSNAANDAQEKYSAEIREFQTAIPENKKCFECDQRGPTYVDMTIGSFVCTKCSGMLRGITPPHRIKSISMSSFTSEEVAFLKSRGNIWCGKVWMGLYDKNRSGALEAKDDESLKSHIIQKYEKKSYYVDPSTIQQSLTAATSASHPTSSSTGSSSLLGSSSGGFIGTTLTQRSSHVARPSSSSTSSNTSPIIKPVTIPKSNGNIRTGLSGVILPPPVSIADPFTSSSAAAPASSALLTSSTTSVSAGGVPPPVAATAAVTKSSNATVMESFANFDAVKFDDISDPWSNNPSAGGLPAKSDPKSNSVAHPASTFKSGSAIMTPRNSSSSQSPALAVTEVAKIPEVVEDKYAALKDLDEIFKNTVVVTDGNSTGTSIFGSSPMAAQPSAQPQISPTTNVFGPSPTNNGLVGEFPTTWGTTTTDARNPDHNAAGPSPNAGWASNWPSSSTTNNGSKAAPINPFTGASNLTQLNTSPWPTTGTSPVQSSSQSSTTNNWSNFANMSSSTSSSSPANNMSKMGTLGPVQHVTSHPGVSPSDPFGAAPATNLQNSAFTMDPFDWAGAKF